jgi:hypothetical protein
MTKRLLTWTILAVLTIGMLVGAYLIVEKNDTGPEGEAPAQMLH